MSRNEFISNRDSAPPYGNYNPFFPEKISSSKIDNPFLPKNINSKSLNPFIIDSEAKPQINSNNNNPFLSQGNNQENSDGNKTITSIEKHIKYENNKITINEEENNPFITETNNRDINKEVGNIFLYKNIQLKSNQSIPESNGIIFASPKELNYAGTFNLNSNEVNFGFKENSDKENKNEIINNKLSENNIKENNLNQTKNNYNPFLLNQNNGNEKESLTFSFTKIINNNNIEIKNVHEQKEEYTANPLINDIIKKEEIKPINTNPFISNNKPNSNLFSSNQLITCNTDKNDDNKREQCENDIKDFINHSYNPFLSHNDNNQPKNSSNNPFFPRKDSNPINSENIPFSSQNNNKPIDNNYNPFLAKNENNKDILSINNHNGAIENNFNQSIINNCINLNKNSRFAQNNEYKEENGNPFNSLKVPEINSSNPFLNYNNTKNDNINEKNESQTYDIYNSIQNLEKLDAEINEQNNDLNKEIKPLNFSTVSNIISFTDNQNKKEINFSSVPEQNVQKDENAEKIKFTILPGSENFSLIQNIQYSETTSQPSFPGGVPTNKNTKAKAINNEYNETEMKNNDKLYKLEDSPIKNDNQRIFIEVNNPGTFSLGNHSEIESKDFSNTKKEEKVNQIQLSEIISDNNQIEKKFVNKNLNNIISSDNLTKNDLPSINNIIDINKDETKNENKEISNEDNNHYNHYNGKLPIKDNSDDKKSIESKNKNDDILDNNEKRIINSPKNDNIDDDKEESTQEKQNTLLTDLIKYKKDESKDNNIISQKIIQNNNTEEEKNENENGLNMSLHETPSENGKDGDSGESNENKVDDDESEEKKANEMISLNNKEITDENENEENKSKDSYNEDNKEENGGTNVEEKVNDENIDVKSESNKSLNNNNRSNKKKDSFNINNIGEKTLYPETTPISSNDLDEKENKEEKIDIHKDKENEKVNEIKEIKNEMDQEVEDEEEEEEEGKEEEENEEEKKDLENKGNKKIFISDIKEKEYFEEAKSQSDGVNNENNETEINLNIKDIEKNEETQKEIESEEEEAYNDNNANKKSLEQKQSAQYAYLEFKNNYKKELRNNIIPKLEISENGGKISSIKEKSGSNNIYNNLIQKMINIVNGLKNKINIKEKYNLTIYKNKLDKYIKELENSVEKFKLRYLKTLIKKHYTKDENEKIQVVNESNLAKKRNDVNKIFKELISFIKNKLELQNQKYYYLIIIKLLMKYNNITKDDLKRFIKLYKLKKYNYKISNNSWIKGYKSTGFKAFTIIIPLFYIANYIYANIKSQF